MSVRELINILKEIEDIVKSLPFQKEKATDLHFRLVELYSQYKEYEEDNYIYHLIKSVNFPNVEIHTNYVIECMEIFDKISKKELYSQYKEYEEDNYIYHLIKSVNFPNVEIHTNYVIECMEIFDKISKKVYANPKDECFEKPVFWNDKVVSVFFDLYNKELIVRNPKKKTTFRATYTNYKDFYERLLKDLTIDKLVEL